VHAVPVKPSQDDGPAVTTDFRKALCFLGCLPATPPPAPQDPVCSHLGSPFGLV